MSDKEPAHVTVRILEKEYFVSCPQDERADLLDSAEYLNKKMREIRDTGKVVGADRIAVMAALNMANELLRLQEQVSEGLKRFEFGLRRKVEDEADRALVSGSDEVPQEFRKLVEQYYKSLSKGGSDKEKEK